MDHPQPSTSAVHRFFRVPKFIWRKLRNYWKPTIPERRVARCVIAINDLSPDAYFLFRPPSIHVRQVPNPMNYLRPEPISPDDRSSFFFFTGSAPTLRRRFTDDDHYSYTEAGHGSSPVSRSVSRLDIRERPRVPPLP
ncbi:hypothetical protein ONZ45_g679 [Pleurotus djamor]|nr:hypothetical protein ONZ45_g679 [Pleurotus djamor]